MVDISRRTVAVVMLLVILVSVAGTWNAIMDKPINEPQGDLSPQDETLTRQPLDQDQDFQKRGDGG